MTNSLLFSAETTPGFSLPAFDRFKAADVVPGLQQLLDANRAAVDRLVASAAAQPPSWESFIEPLTDREQVLEQAWSPVQHLHAVCNSPELREAYAAALALLSAYHTEMSQNRGLFEAYRSLRDRAEPLGLDSAQIKLLDDALLGFQLAGIDRDDATRERLGAINARLSELTNAFESNVLDATQNWTLELDEPRLAGLPDAQRELLAQNARQRDQEGWLATLDFPSYHAILTYAEDRPLRAETYRAFATRASDEGPDAGRFDNGPLILEILALREEKARLTGFSHYAERSLATKMADSVETVESFLLDLAARARAAAERERVELQERARTDGIDPLEPWDQAFYAEKLRAEKYAISQEELRAYFPAEAVVDGLFRHVERLFGVTIRETTTAVPVWSEAVRFHEILDAEGNALAGFYLDLYARKDKRGGAWMDVCRSRRRRGSQLNRPVAYMTCNSTPPVGSDPALFTHDEVITLFHEFGHGLHHMLTEIDHPDIAGISGVEWDAVELPSQFMENWCWERSALDAFARHWKTGDAMPADLFERLTATRHFHEALQTVRQCEFSLFDLRLHARPALASVPEILDLLERVRDEVAVARPPAWHRFPHAFTHIFAGGYAAGYYSYKWAEVLSADAFARFEEEGLDNPEIGRAYRREILAVGASRPAMASFVAFRGREPTIDALLRHSGLAGDKVA